MINYEQQDYDVAKRMIELGYFLNSEDRQPVALTEENIVDLAKKYYDLRIRTYNPNTGNHF